MISSLTLFNSSRYGHSRREKKKRNQELKEEAAPPRLKIKVNYNTANIEM